MLDACVVDQDALESQHGCGTALATSCGARHAERQACARSTARAYAPS